MRGLLFNTEQGQLEGLAGYGGSYTLPPPGGPFKFQMTTFALFSLTLIFPCPASSLNLQIGRLFTREKPKARGSALISALPA